MAMELTNGLDFLNGHKKLGILGAGQLGKMTAIAAANWQLPLWALDKQADYPAAPYIQRLVCGNFNDEKDVLAFGKEVDLLTIEIEHVNTAALHQLQAEGLRIHPAPQILDTIKDKGLQKLFYQQHQLPTAAFTLFDHAEQLREALDTGQLHYPFVQKSRTDGYDGRGVAVIKDASSLHKLLPGACVVEQLVDIDKEVAVIVARNESGEVKAFPVVEMYFHPEANLVDRLLAPARISDQQAQAATALAIRTAAAFDVCGLLAVEMFIDRQGQLLVNEVAPRSHNSGHHTIESCAVSQFEQHLRAVLNLFDRWELTSVQARRLLGEPSERTYQRWRKGDIAAIPHDTVFRLGALLGIHKALRYMFTEPERGYAWIRKPNTAFGGRRALDKMLQGAPTDLAAVRAYLDTERGAW